jgi:hypothetical protein
MHTVEPGVMAFQSIAVTSVQALPQVLPSLPLPLGATKKVADGAEPASPSIAHGSPPVSTGLPLLLDAVVDPLLVDPLLVDPLLVVPLLVDPLVVVPLLLLVDPLLVGPLLDDGWCFELVELDDVLAVPPLPASSG